jgi:long-chain fatty acid transport protein
MDWKDTWRLGLGAHYRPIQKLLLKAGFSYDSDPTSLANRLPSLPASHQWRYATGFDWDWNKNVVLSFNYEFVDLGKARIDKDIQPIVVDPPGTQTTPTTIFPGRQFDGDYNQFLNFVGFSLRWKFGKGEPDESKKQPENTRGVKIV